MARPSSRPGRLRVGTSGWSYGAWWGPFFPAHVKKKDALEYYASLFECVELNNPFYRTPTMEAVQSWASGTPDTFCFAWKASQFITHWKRLSANARNSLDLMQTRLEALGSKAGPVLFQLPPQMKADPQRLMDFVAMLDRRWRYTFEFRHPSWYEAAILRVLEDNDIALCISDHADAPAPWVRTASFVYVRGHGPSGRYHGTYSNEALGQWARDMKRWSAQGHDVWCFFDNDMKSAAPADAARLIGLLKMKRTRAAAGGQRKTTALTRR